MSQTKLVRVIPPPTQDGEPTLGRGTRVMVGDEQVRRVRSVTLRADAKGAWVATIEVEVQLDGDVVACLQLGQPGTL